MSQFYYSSIKVYCILGWYLCGNSLNSIIVRLKYKHQYPFVQTDNQSQFYYSSIKVLLRLITTMY